MQHYIREQFEFLRDVNAQERYTNDLEKIYDPLMYNYKFVDMVACDPVWRQLILDMEQAFEQQVALRAEQGAMLVFKGDCDFWQVLDNSFDPENIRKVQIAIGD